MSEDVLCLRRRTIPRHTRAPLARAARQRTPEIQPSPDEAEADLDGPDLSSSPPRLAPEVDFELTELLDILASHLPSEILTLRYSAELHILHDVSQAGCGTAYVHYTWYLILNRITHEIGLHINKPAQTTTVDEIPIAYEALFEWAQLKSGSFGNVKRTII
ncbi:hypothetical protein B0H17DRAFT_1207206 [Mycena rosella]|uniref:Uncharacterized protein n=1 Tax=Mycena rosella TaxID=1033263 RepID=A0AAD7D375_MYCRO|nr:hypothetical protein B0H17DRAFT_1207206 [Mycena rosella]